MAVGSSKRATIDDLLRLDGKAELISGRIIPFMAGGHRPNKAAGRIYRSLADYADQVGRGEVYTDNVSFAVPELASGRESFSPDASYYEGPLPTNLMRFVEGPPTLAVEVRSEGDYGPAAERAITAKRADYFAAGTLVVWDVDRIANTIRVYRSTDPGRPTTYHDDQVAEAEPAVPGWRVPVQAIFR